MVKRWKKEIPDKNGWFWLKLPSGETSIVFVKNGMIKSLGGYYVLDELCRDLHPQWAGPIEKPEEE